MEHNRALSNLLIIIAVVAVSAAIIITGVTNVPKPDLQKPEIVNGGDGENEMNSKECLYLYVQCLDERDPAGAEIYRREEGAAEFERIDLNREEEPVGATGTYRDDTVVPGTVYEYKVRTYSIWLFRKFYSQFSDPVVLPAVNFKGRYNVRAVTPPGETEEFVSKLTSDRYNGMLMLRDIWDIDGPFYSTDEDNDDRTGQKVKLTSWSKDGKTWEPIPKDGLMVKSSETVFLKFRFTEGQQYFAAGEGKASYLFGYGWADYIGSAGAGGTTLTIDFVEGAAEAFCDYDN